MSTEVNSPGENLDLQGNSTGRDYMAQLKFNPVLEAISKNGFWFKVKADATFEPEEYSCISRI